MSDVKAVIFDGDAQQAYGICTNGVKTESFALPDFSKAKQAMAQVQTACTTSTDEGKDPFPNLVGALVAIRESEKRGGRHDTRMEWQCKNANKLYSPGYPDAEMLTPLPTPQAAHEMLLELDMGCHGGKTHIISYGR